MDVNFTVYRCRVLCLARSLEEMFNMAGEDFKCGGPKIKIQTAGYKIIQNVRKPRISADDAI